MTNGPPTTHKRQVAERRVQSAAPSTALCGVGSQGGADGTARRWMVLLLSIRELLELASLRQLAARLAPR